MSPHAHPSVLVSTDWVAESLPREGFLLVESNENTLLYSTGHLAGAVHIDWTTDLQDQTIRDYITPEAFARLCGRHGISPETTVIFYGDKANWWACFAFWVFHLFGHTNCKILDGGRDKWIAEGRPLTRELPAHPPAHYPIPPRRRDAEIRAFYEETLAHSKAGNPLVDVRSPGEFRGEITHMPEYPQEGVLRGGHIPGAISMPWERSVAADGTFLPIEELHALYEKECRLNPGDAVVTYCRIGERSSHTWFILTQLLGFENVRNYDGSWTEWGNRVQAPIKCDT